MHWVSDSIRSNCIVASTYNNRTIVTSILSHLAVLCQVTPNVLAGSPFSFVYSNGSAAGGAECRVDRVSGASGGKPLSLYAVAELQ